MPLDIDKILDDKHSGSVIITKNTLHVYKELLKEAASKKMNQVEAYEQFQSVSKKILKHQPNMVLLRKSTGTIQIYFKRLIKSDKDRDEVLKAVEKKITGIEKEIDTRMDKIALTGSKIIAPTNKIMTISNSTLVRNILKTTHKQKRKFEVYCCKSHPPDEGVLLAESLDKSGIKTTLISDSQAGVFMQDMNLILIGADRIYEDGFVNKAGTLALCLTANFYNVPVYLAADTTKILPESERMIKLTSQDKKEVYDGSRKKLSVENIYYEKIPIKLIHKVICEDSIFDTVDFINWYLKE